MSGIPDYNDHPLSSVLPMMSQSEMWELENDIRENGLRFPIMLLDGQILDGRNRYKACKKAGVDPQFENFNGQGDPLAFIVSVNVKRRHLNASQRALIAAKIANMPHGDISRAALPKETKTEKPQQSPQTANLQLAGKTVTAAAKELEVSPRQVATAREVLRKAPNEEIQKIERGEKTVTKVAAETKAKEEKPKAKETSLDKTGYPIPESVVPDWVRAEGWAKLILGLVSDARSQLKAGFENDGLILTEVTNSTVADLNNAYTSLKCVVPYAVCTSCQGRQRKKCNLCKGRGFISEFMWRQVVPEETKKIRQMGVKK